ncbi:uncharacterized protein LOC125152736 isoform X5 [Prionailurus viverrinus]|uniref:uncharacterized protein LOC125152736 isoform X5 n=1 Tax=Prionailurus viverrinus TaxID=61388 RepID=UPI001FF2EAD2|nr:uncharacterized protein LOC125152736 isoform X5 [Prionailurus viverrinus]
MGGGASAEIDGGRSGVALAWRRLRGSFRAARGGDADDDVGEVQHSKGSVPGDGGAVGKRRDLFSTFKGVCSESSRCERNPVKSRVAGADMVSSWEEDRKFILRGWSLVFSILAALMMLSVVDGRLAYLQGSYTGYLGFWTDCRKYKCVSLGQVTVLIHMSMGFMMLALTLCLILLPFMCLSFRPVFRRLTKIDLVFSFLSFSTGFLIVLSLTLFVVNCETLLPRPQVSYLVTTYLCWGAGALMLLAARHRPLQFCARRAAQPAGVAPPLGLARARPWMVGPLRPRPEVALHGLDTYPSEGEPRPWILSPDPGRVTTLTASGCSSALLRNRPLPRKAWPATTFPSPPHFRTSLPQ